MYKLDDTIFAQTTVPGRSAVSMVRLSGPEALNVIKKLFRPSIQDFKSHTLKYGRLHSPLEKNKILDEVIVSYFEAGRSYTNEEVIEVATHGNPIIINQIFEVFESLGLRLAEPGEFTYRAFVNGRIDLTEAEAVHDIISSKSKQGYQSALNLVNKGLRLKLDQFYNDLLLISAHMEADIDFNEQNIEVDHRGELIEQMSESQKQLSDLLGNYINHELVQQGVRVLLYGPTNVGKSSLLNGLLGYNRALVSPIEGTTRDYVSEKLYYKGLEIELYDSAGLNSSAEGLEKLGITESLNLIPQMNVILNLSDTGDFSNQKLVLGSNQKELQIQTKSDLMTDEIRGSHCVSSMTGENLTFILDQIHEYFLNQNFQADDGLMVSKRAYSHLKSCSDEFQKAFSLLKSDESFEFILFHLNRARSALNELFYEKNDEAVRDKIFSSFCIGK